MLSESGWPIVEQAYCYPVISMEIVPGKYMPCATIISLEQVWVLEHIPEEAINRWKTPDILKKYPEDIILYLPIKGTEVEFQSEPIFS